MRRAALSLALVLVVTACAAPKKKVVAQPAEEANVDAQVKDWLTQQVALLMPLEQASNLAWFEASTTGTDEAFEKSKQAEDTLLRYYAEPARFKRVREALDGGKIQDPLLARQLDVLYRSMLGKQVEPALLSEINVLEKQVEQAFNTYRGVVGKKELTQNDINDILKTSTDSKKLQAAWEAQKGVGPLVAPTLIKLVELRNQVAKALGYRDFYAMRLAESELDEEALLKLFDELDTLTREPFLKAKAEVDARLAKRLKIKPDKLMPWHYQNAFFQEPPEVFDTGLDAAYKKQDVLALTTAFYKGLGLEVEDILARSDLYEKPGKSPHAFATDIDRAGDVRILCNIKPGFEWTSTTVHELGHAIYDKYINGDLPWLLRRSSHALTTEGLAMMMDRQVGNPRWAFAMKVLDEKKRDKALGEAQLQQAFASLQFSRWTQVMLRFERELYRDPAQDLDALWWTLVSTYQGLTKPEGRAAPDYASKIHLVIVPVYYHNYMLGELFSAQLHETLAALEGKPPLESVYVDSAAVGSFLKDKLFAPGASQKWDALTETITGKPLSAEAFARRFAP